MKTTPVLATVFTLSAAGVYAGGMAAPVMEMEPVVIEETTAGSSSSAGLIIPLILIALVAAALSSGSSGGMVSTVTGM